MSLPFYTLKKHWPKQDLLFNDDKVEYANRVTEYIKNSSFP